MVAIVMVMHMRMSYYTSEIGMIFWHVVLHCRQWHPFDVTLHISYTALSLYLFLIFKLQHNMLQFVLQMDCDFQTPGKQLTTLG